MTTDQQPTTPPPAPGPPTPVEPAPPETATDRATPSWLTTGVIAALFALGGVAIGANLGSGDGTTTDQLVASAQLPQGQLGQAPNGQVPNGQVPDGQGPAGQAPDGQGQLGQGQGPAGPGQGLGRPATAGTITALDGSTLTVEATDPQTGDVATTTVVVTDETRVTELVDGVPTELTVADLAEGDTVRVIGTVDGDAVVAEALLLGDGPGLDAGPDGGGVRGA